MTYDIDFNDKCLQYLNFDRFRERYLKLVNKYKNYNNPECTVVWYPLYQDEVVEMYNIHYGEQKNTPSKAYHHIFTDCSIWWLRNEVRNGYEEELCEDQFQKFIQEFCYVLQTYDTSETIKIVRSKFEAVNECLLEEEDVDAIDDCR